MNTLPVCPECRSANPIGIEISEVYDGVLYWVCGDCSHAWSRDWRGYGRRCVVAAEMVQASNEKLAAIRAES